MNTEQSARVSSLVKFAHTHGLNTETVQQRDGTQWVVIYTPGGDPIDGDGMAFSIVKALAHWIGY